MKDSACQPSSLAWAAVQDRQSSAVRTTRTTRELAPMRGFTTNGNSNPSGTDSSAPTLGISAHLGTAMPASRRALFMITLSRYASIRPGVTRASPRPSRRRSTSFSAYSSLETTCTGPSAAHEPIVSIHWSGESSLTRSGAEASGRTTEVDVPEVATTTSAETTDVCGQRTSSPLTLTRSEPCTPIVRPARRTRSADLAAAYSDRSCGWTRGADSSAHD